MDRGRCRFLHQPIGAKGMQVLHLVPGRPAVAAPSLPSEEKDGYFWVDIERDESDWYPELTRWLGFDLREHHLLESIDSRHLPFYDGTDDYDLLALQTLDPASPTEAPLTRPVAIFVTPRVLISIRSNTEQVFARVGQRLLAGQRKSPASAGALLALLISQIVERLLDWRETVTELITAWQDRLLGEDRAFDDWQSLTRLRCHLRRLEAVSEDQLDALSAWREQTGLALDADEHSRFDALRRELDRIFSYSAVMQADIDSLLQTHFAAVGQRTNEILRFLTVISTVFLPLNLIAGVFGMNFVHLPFLKDPVAPFLTLGVMAVIAAGVIAWSRSKRWF
jgi:Mg2+ and Co2+ transporter CorA